MVKTLTMSGNEKVNAIICLLDDYCMMQSWRFSSVDGIIELFWGDIPPFLFSDTNNKQKERLHRE